MKIKEVDGIGNGGGWAAISPAQFAKDRLTKVWEGECVFVKYITVEAGFDLTQNLQLDIEYQTCNDKLCRPAAEKTLEFRFEKKKQ